MALPPGDYSVIWALAVGTANADFGFLQKGVSTVIAGATTDAQVRCMIRDSANLLVDS